MADIRPIFQWRVHVLKIRIKVRALQHNPAIHITTQSAQPNKIDPAALPLRLKEPN